MAVQVACGKCGYPLTESSGSIQTCPWCHTENSIDISANESTAGKLISYIVIGGLIVVALQAAFGRREV